jgi:RNA polymerase sigma-70 factor, ECF subfamily
MSSQVGQIAEVFRREHGRAVATLVRYFGDIDIAEEAVQEAFEVAGWRWPEGAVPPNPAAWITATARYLALDRLRREASPHGRHSEAALGDYTEPPMPAGEEPDDRLRLIFTCCHPSLDRSDQVALTLHLFGGLTAGQIARALTVPAATVDQRIVRAKRKIKSAAIPYSVPAMAELPARLDAILATINLTFSQGASTTSNGDAPADPDLGAEAIRLARMMAELMPDEPEVLGLLALLLLTHSRRAARMDSDGAVVPLRDQDRSHWDRAMIEEGQELVDECVRRNEPGPYQIQAVVQAVHSAARSTAHTDWSHILALYDLLMEFSPTRVVAFNRAVALAETDGPEAALAVIDKIDLRSYHLYHSTRADLLCRLGRNTEAARAYQAALQLTGNEAERLYLAKRQRSATDSARPWLGLAKARHLRDDVSLRHPLPVNGVVSLAL